MYIFAYYRNVMLQAVQICNLRSKGTMVASKFSLLSFADSLLPSFRSRSVLDLVLLFFFLSFISIVCSWDSVVHVFISGDVEVWMDRWVEWNGGRIKSSNGVHSDWIWIETCLITARYSLEMVIERKPSAMIMMGCVACEGRAVVVVASDSCEPWWLVESKIRSLWCPSPIRLMEMVTLKRRISRLVIPAPTRG